MALRPYQQEARQAVAALVAQGKRALLTVLPTGTGKTVLFAAEVADRTKNGEQAVVLAHRDELITQPVEVLRRTAPGLEVGVVKASRNEVAAQVVVASVQSLAQPRRLEALVAAGLPALVVTDEAHHAIAGSYLAVYDALHAGRADGPLHLGYTATPQRTDGVGLAEVFEDIAFARDIREMVTANWLTEPSGRIVAAGIDLDRVRRNDAGDFSDAGLDEAMDEQVVEVIAAAWCKHGRDRVTVAFTPSVRTAKLLAEAVNRLDGAGTAGSVDGETPTDPRRALLAGLKAGKVRFVANCGVLTEGFDAPNVSCILVARPTKSESLYTQMVGRGLRLHPGKADCLVLDVTGITARHSLCVLPTLFGLSTSDMEGKTVSQVAEEEVERARSSGIRLADVEAQVDLLRRRRRWAWTEVEERRVYAVNAGTDRRGNSVVVVVRALYRNRSGPWMAEARRYHGRHTVAIDTLCRIDGETAAEDAFGAAETWLAANPIAARMAGAGGWRAATGAELATPAQIRALHRWRVRVPAGMTKAEASDLLTQAIVAARLRAGG